MQKRFCLWVILLSLAVLGDVQTIRGAPPEYATFGREQRIDHQPDERDVLRVWMVFVGQGDGILIQLPPKYNYDPDRDDADDGGSEQVDVLIDGGAFRSENGDRMRRFITSLYGPNDITIEHAVVTHHDLDHVRGLIEILRSRSISIEAMYHNGLASYRPGVRKFPESGRPEEPGIYKYKRGKITRGMALLEADGETMQPSYLVDSLPVLRTRYRNSEFHGIYDELARAITTKSEPSQVFSFDRVWEGHEFVIGQESELERVDLDGISFDVLWPRERPRKYGDWGESINGNSVTFRLAYGDFEMLFTGDHNEKSEEALLKWLEASEGLSRLECDVLKVPHHGSSHAFREFFGEKGCKPVVSVASMGAHGAKSKKIQSGAWQHPSTDVIKWLGGTHRVYHTLMHERRFKWDLLTTNAAHRNMYERTHVLIETDGDWFRVVEVNVDHLPLDAPPSVRSTRRGNGTRWIKAE